MMDYLKTVFGETIMASDYKIPDGAPAYMRYDYKAYMVSWNGNTCVVLSPVYTSWRLPTLKKQLKKFQSICDYPCALGLENMTSLQRKNLLEENIPFVSASQQVYFPFWGTAFTEKFRAEATNREKMAPGTQMVFLYLYYRSDTEPVNLTQIAERLHVSKATCNRAINDLVSSGLITLQDEGRIKWISMSCEKSDFLKKGYPRLKTPIERNIYLKLSSEVPDFPKSGLKALSEISMVGENEFDGGIAVYKKEVSCIPKDSIISEREFEDFGGHVIEVWSYDPVMFSNDNRVDDISLLLSLEGNVDERVQMGLDEIRERHGLPIEFTEDSPELTDEELAHFYRVKKEW